MLRKYFRIAPLFLIIPLIIGCHDFDELSQDPYNRPFIDTEGGEEEEEPVTGPYADLDIHYQLGQKEIDELRQGQSNVGPTFANLTYEGCYADYQRTTNLTHDMYSRYAANNHPNFVHNSPNYKYTEDWSSRRWNHFYADRTVQEYTQLLRVFKFVDYEKYKNAFYITRIYWAFLASMQADTYGDIPLSSYVQGKIPKGNVEYDTQEKAYDIIFRLLEQATDSIAPDACTFKFALTDDKCYGGDERKWLRFANSLRLRLALRISNADPARARKEGEAALSNPWGLMQNDDDKMRTVPRHAPEAQGGINAGGEENAFAMCSMGYNGDCVMSKDMEVIYKTQSTGGYRYPVISMNPEIPTEEKVIDPRCAVCWYRPNNIDELKTNMELPFTDFAGCANGNDDVSHSVTVEKYSITRSDILNSKKLDPKNYFSYARESIWMSYSEVQFLLAEAALRNWNGTSKSPQQYFESGIRASMNYYQIPVAEIDSYIRGLNIYKSNSDNPFMQNDREQILEQIITQKWLAVFPNGNEGWAEFRRTDYPRLSNLLNNRSEDVPVGKFIKRILYPYSEKDNPHKPENKNTQGTRVWWDVADTNDATGNRVIPRNFN